MTTYVKYERTLKKHLRIEEGPPVGASFAVHVGTSSSSSSLNQAHAQAIVKVPQSEEKFGMECIGWQSFRGLWLVESGA